MHRLPFRVRVSIKAVGKKLEVGLASRLEVGLAGRLEVGLARVLLFK